MLIEQKPQKTPIEGGITPDNRQVSTGDPQKRRKLSHEILGLLGISFAIALFLFAFLRMTAATIAENYCDRTGLPLNYLEASGMEMWIFGLSLLTAALFFILLFLSLLGQKIAYIKNITEGIEALRTHRMDFIMPLEGNNELTQLAETINYLSATEKKIREKERALQNEKEQLIRSLSHDIRTPLTSIMSYSELLLAQKEAAHRDSAVSRESIACREKEHLELILKKAEQIKALTDILLDGSRREPEYFEDARLLMEQLAAEMEEALEDSLTEMPAAPVESPGETMKAEQTGGCGLSIDLSGCPAFAGTFDLGELRRIFDNLTSNILKYADLTRPVTLEIRVDDRGLVLHQENTKRTDSAPAESHRLGLASIRRIAHNYGGAVDVLQDETHFDITIRLSDI